MAGILLASVAEAKAMLRIDTDAGDANLELQLRAASRAVLRYLKTPDAYRDTAGDPILDSAGDVADVDEDVKLATIMLTGTFLRDPDGAESEKWQQGYLPAPVVSILYPLRDPSLA